MENQINLEKNQRQLEADKIKFEMEKEMEL